MTKKIKTLASNALSLILRHPKTVLIITTLLTVLSFYFIQKIQIRSNFSDLLPDNHPAVVQAKELEKIVGGASFIVVTVQTKDEKAAASFLADLKKRVLSQDHQKEIRYIDDQPPADFLKKEGLLYLSLKDLDKLTDRLRHKIDQAKLQKTHLYINFDDPKPSTDSPKEWDDLSEQYASFLTSNTHYQNRAGTLFVSLIKPEWRTTDVSRTAHFIEGLEKTIHELNPSATSLDVRLTGPYIKTMTQKKILLKDAVLVSLVSFIGSILYLIVHFRRKRAVFLIGLPLTVSSFWALSLAYFLFGSLNLFSSVACAVMLGLATDYGIHIYTEYTRYLDQGLSAMEALKASLKELGLGFVAASGTTAAAFFSLMFSRFKALYEFGAIAGCGIILSFLAYLFVFPALTLLVEKHWAFAPRTGKAGCFGSESGGESRFSSPISPHRGHSFVSNWLFSKKNLIASGVILLLPLLTIAMGRLRFDYNLNHIMGQQETKELDHQVDSIFSHSVNPEVALAKDLPDASHLAHAIRRTQKENKETPEGTTIKGVLSLADFVPDEQKERIEKIHTIQSLFTPLVLRSLNTAQKKSYEDLKMMLNPVEVSLSGLPQQIKEKFRDREGSLGRMVFIFPNFEMNQADRFMRYVEEIRGVQCTDCTAPFYASGESTVFYEIVKMLLQEGKYVIGFTILAVLSALFLSFRSLKRTLIVFTPLMVGMLATLGWMGLTGIPFNIINVAALPIILGSVDDYAVLYYQRIADHPEQSLGQSHHQSLAPVFGSAMTSLIGFGSLLFADMGGIRSFGLICTVGITICTLTTLVWFPAFLAFLGRKNK
ncbi:MAG: MMPL family transporter [Deltaproteobacteria bacterium]|nr:MMPL family transporter [Deltaproteobacteria bacterium]